MQPIDVKLALAYLLTPPVRPRYQERTMAVTFIADDDACSRVVAVRCRATTIRITALASDLAHSVSGNVGIFKTPMVGGGLLLLALGLTTLVR